MSLLSSSNGALLSLSEGLADETCSDACCGGGGGECSIVQLVACECGDVAFVCLPDSYLSCQPGEPDFGPPAIGTVVRVGPVGPYPGRCWEVVEHWDEWPPVDEFVNPPLGYVHTELLPECAGSCGDEACTDYGHLCPPGTCGWEMCNGWQDFDPDSCGFITRSVRVDEVLVVSTAQVNLLLDAVNIAGPANPIGAPSGSTLEAFNGTLTYSVVCETRFRFEVGSGPVCVSNSMRVFYKLDLVYDRPFNDPGFQHTEIHNEYELLGFDCPASGIGGPTVLTPCGNPVPVLGAQPPECGIGNECLFNGSHSVRDLMCGDAPVGAAFFWDTFWQITRAECASFEVMGGMVDPARYPYTCDETYVLEDTHTALGGDGCGIENDTTDQVRIAALGGWNFKRTTRTRNEQVRQVTCQAGVVSTDATWNYQFTGAVQQKVVWSRCVDTEATERGGRDEETKRRRDEVAGMMHDPAAWEVIRRMTTPCAGCGG